MKWAYRLLSLSLLIVGFLAFAEDLPRLVFLSKWDDNIPFPDLTGVSALTGYGFLIHGSLNLLNQRYGPIAPGLRRVTLAANLFLSVVCLRLGFDPGYGAVGWVVVGLLVATSAVSVMALKAKEGDPRR